MRLVRVTKAEVEECFTPTSAERLTLRLLWELVDRARESDLVDFDAVDPPVDTRFVEGKGPRRVKLEVCPGCLDCRAQNDLDGPPPWQRLCGGSGIVDPQTCDHDWEMGLEAHKFVARRCSKCGKVEMVETASQTCDHSWEFLGPEEVTPKGKLWHYRCAGCGVKKRMEVKM